MEHEDDGNANDSVRPQKSPEERGKENGGGDWGTEKEVRHPRPLLESDRILKRVLESRGDILLLGHQ